MITHYFYTNNYTNIC